MADLYLEPRTIEQAVAALAEHGEDAKVVAGGTDLVVQARKRRTPLAPVLVAIHRIDELCGIGATPDGVLDGGSMPAGALRIGATTPHADIEHHPEIVRSFTALADGSALVGSPATRYAGTLGGNLANASPANDTGSALLVFDASVELTSGSGIRHIGLAELFKGPGETSLRPGELITAIDLPATGSGAVGSAYIRLDYRLAMEIAVVGAAAMVKLDDQGRVADARLALTAVAPTCIEVEGMAEALRGGDPDDPATWAEAGRLTAEVARPIDDVRAPAAYRAAMVPVIARRAFAVALRRARGEHVAVPASSAPGSPVVTA